VEIKLVGFAELQRDLKQFGTSQEFKNGHRAATRAGAAVFRDAARATAPVKSGALRAGIVVNSRRSDGPHMVRYGARVRPGKRGTYANSQANRRKGKAGKKYSQDGPEFYGKFLEYGTSKMQARPFMRPAFGANVNRALDAFKARLARAVELSAKK
jgi:HK97 gp10 family phage protein